VLLAIVIFQYEVDQDPESIILVILLISFVVICRVDSIEKFRGKLPSLRAELKDDSEFPFQEKLLYYWSYVWPLLRVSFSLELDVWSEMIPFSFPYRTCLFYTYFHPDKFREIYNFAFTWAREKVSLNCRIFHPVYTGALGIFFLIK
jgi:hypothetical protein